MGTVLEQYTYEPYGTVLVADNLDVDQYGVTRHAVNRVGFQGLFFERYDGSYFEPSIAPGVAGLYYARNRFYAPALGRFLQRDPNETGIPIIAALAMSGEATSILFGGLNASALYDDGMNLYEFAGSNPVNSRDPLGLDVWDDFDDEISDFNGLRMATTGYIQTAAGFMLIGITSSLNIASSLLGFDVFNSAKSILQGKGTFWDYLDVGLTLAGPLAKAGKLAAKFGMKAGGKAFGWGKEFFTRAYKRCNCFVAGTLVDTPDGPVNIESIQEGDEVMTRDQGCPECPPKAGRVTRVFARVAPAILWLALADGTVLGTTPGHEVWTEQAGWTFAADVRVGNTFVDREGCPAAIVGMWLDPRPTPVYNLEIDGTFTYFVDGLWVHNNSCDLAARAIDGFRGLLKWTEKSAEHVRRHNHDNLTRDIHGIFDNDGVLATEEAWARAQQLGMNLDARSGINVPMGKFIGREGGYEGTGQGLSTIRIVMTQTGEVISAYPVRP